MVMCSRGTSLGLRMALNRRKVHCTVDDLHRSFAAFCLREKELIREEKKVRFSEFVNFLPTFNSPGAKGDRNIKRQGQG